MADSFNRSDLDTPVASTRRSFLNMDGDAVGVGAEKIARFLGTGKYLAYQTIFVVIWVACNIGGMWWNWDPYPFILLNLAFSTQAAYAAPLILLAQNRQDDRDRVALNEDRRRAAQTKADTEFLARELAGVRIALGETVTRDYLRHELEELATIMQRIEGRLDDAAIDSEQERDLSSDSASDSVRSEGRQSGGSGSLSDPTS